MIDHIILFIVLALIAEIIGTVGGFGSSLFFIPIASYFLDFHSVLGITAMYHVMSNLTKIALFRQGVDKKVILWIGIPSVIFVIIGAYLSSYFQAKRLELFLGIFLIVLSIVLFVYSNIKLKPTFVNSFSGGIISGFLAGVIGTGGAIRGIVLASFDLSPSAFIATSSIIDLSIDLSRSVVYFFNGFVHSHDLYLLPILALVSVVGTYFGKKIVLKLSNDQFKKGVLILVFVTGIVSLVKNVF
jgi:uncharacterized membrane protein YfcA